MTKIAVAIVHGIGKQDPTFADEMIEELKDLFVSYTKKKGKKSDLVVQPVYWAPALQANEDELWKRIKHGGELDFITLRRFMVDFAADAIAYQPTPSDRQVYDNVHAIYAGALKQLATDAGANAPLCVISHSLGTVISSNYFYDLTQEFQTTVNKQYIGSNVKGIIGNTPLERGETLTLFYTMGSPVAIWSLRYKDYGMPISIPSPLIDKHYPSLQGEWVNYYDEDDVIGYPLKTLNAAYSNAVKEDRMINAGGFVSSWNPLSHNGYWTDNDVTKPIAEALAKAWRVVNP